MFRQRNSYSCILRMIPFELPDAEQLNIPQQVLQVASYEKGLVFVAGDSGSGKTTTLATLLRQINTTRSGQLIVTLDDPLEYLHRHDKCVVVQREIYTDTQDFVSGIRAALYQRPDVMMLSDVPNAEVAKALIRASQSGRLMLSAVYGSSVVEALRSLINMFSISEQDSVCGVLATVLKAATWQCMIPGLDGALLPAFEVVCFDETLLTMLKEKRFDELQAAIQASRTADITPLDQSLIALYRGQKISSQTALKYARDKKTVRRQIY